ncbi:MAG TPA: hypothetical protein H9891_06255 [Candidatus Salinicoccus stercoripullorum]|uniref:Uncharacterized protein n=1 Tax=Candidatus Salinicoccus stercoripullorum TaxID=2838756 RepID=A0A9D1QHH2_9STAP|nr:hypothetical protein [Candidatus Salinicoccus stercoripullorum]
MGKILLSGLISGTVAGLLLAGAFSYVQLSTDIELLDLLLNLDFISREEPHIVIQILLHLLVSVVIATILKWIYINRSKLYMPSMVAIWVITTSLYFILSKQAEEPMELHSYIGWTLWSIFHIGYLEVLHICYKKRI